MKKGISDARYFYTSKEIVENLPGLHMLKEIARQNGLYADFVEYDINNIGRHDSSGVYFVCSYLERAVKKLREDPKKMGDVIRENQSVRDLNCKYYAINLTDPNLNEETFFAKYMEIVRDIHDISLVATNCKEFNLKVPRHTSHYFLSDLYHANDIRKQAFMYPDLQDGYSEIIRKHIDNYYKKNDEKTEEKKKAIKDIFKKPYELQAVTPAYFIQNRMAVLNISIEESFWNYIKERIPEESNFRYYKDNKPYIHLKPNNNQDNPNLPNFWKDEVEYKAYYFSFPMGYEHVYATWAIDYCLRNGKNKIHISELEQKSQYPLQEIIVHEDDVLNFRGLLDQNNIQYASVTDMKETDRKLTLHDAVYMPFLYRVEDKTMVEAIQNRLLSEKAEWIPSKEYIPTVFKEVPITREEYYKICEMKKGKNREVQDYDQR